MLRTEHLTKLYGAYRALDDLNLELTAGEVVGLLGPNGSGKTTILRLLLGFLKPSAGRAWIGGHDCWHDSVAARRLTAYLPGELRLYENMTGRQLIQFLSQLRGQPIRAPLADLARRFDIDLDRPIATLSSGMKRKVALLQVLAPQAPLVIMDEPTNTLDPSMRHELLHQVRQARERGQTVLFSSHVLDEVEQVCDRVAILKQGRLVELQPLSQLIQGQLIRARFHQPLGPLPNLEGLTVLENNDGHLILECRGPLPPLLNWLGQQALVDFHLEPLGLHAVYYRHHGAAT